MSTLWWKWRPQLRHLLLGIMLIRAHRGQVTFSTSSTTNPDNFVMMFTVLMNGYPPRF